MKRGAELALAVHEAAMTLLTEVPRAIRAIGVDHGTASDDDSRAFTI